MGDDSTTDAAKAMLVCPACSEQSPARAKFCLECGGPLRPREVAPSEARKTVTVLFCDLVGSTALQAALDPESVRNVMGRFYAAMSAELERHGGHAEKFIGDAVMAVFGAPVVREDDAIRAVRAADGMRSALDGLNEELQQRWGVRLEMRTGLNTGEVVASREGFVVGDAVNVAARLEQAATDGEVLVGEATWRLTRHEASFEAVADLTVKGKSEPLAAYRLLTATPADEDRGRLEAPLIGREDELTRLRRAFALAVEDRACRLATVVGSPGLGKTRLAQEFADEVADRAIVVEGRCEPSGEGITFLPVAEVLRDAAGIGEADPAGDVRAKLAALVPDDPDRDLLVERAAGVLGLAQVAGTEETFWSVRRLLGGLARERPLVVLLDDVHWGQPTFLDLVEHLVEWGRESPILLLALARPELRDTRPSLTTTAGLACEVIELEPLGAETSRRLASELLDRSELPPALAERVLQTTGGNPLFLGEMLRMLVDDGVLRRDGERWVAVGDAAGAEVPPTIAALLGARIERLGADERSVVERAAVIGKQFYRGAVADLAPAQVALGIDAHLEALRRKEVVEPDGTVWIDEPVFRFHHVLIRDAAYRTLLKEARAELHERFADWLQAKAGDLVGEHEEVIAFHLEQAYRYWCELGPLDERGRALGGRAVTMLHATGRRALAREDLPAATNLLGRASAAAEEHVAGDVLVDLLEALLSAGETGQAASVLDQMDRACDGDPRLQAWTVVIRAELAQLTGSTQLAATVATVAATVETFAAAGDDAGVAKAHHVRAQGLALLGQVGEVEATLDKALAAARRAGDARRVTAVLAAAPRAALWGPSPVMRASGRCLDVVRILRMSHGNRHVEAVALRCQAVLEAWRGRAEAARQILDRCRMTLEELGLGLELLETEQHAGIVELVAGDPAAAEARLRAAYDGLVAGGLDIGAAAAAALLARAVLEQGRDEEAFELTRFCEEHGGESLKTTVAWCGLRAQVLARRGEHADAEAFARRATVIAEATDALVDHGDARMALAGVLRAAGRDEDALAEARRARELYEAKGHEAGAERAAAFADERRAAAPVETPVDRPAGIQTAMSQDFRRLADAFSRRDWDALRGCLTEDIPTFDRRPNSPRGDTFGADAQCEALRAYVDASDDVQMPWTLLVQAGSLALARVVFCGHQTDTDSEFAIPMLVVARVDGHRFDRNELFNPEDERAAHAALLALQPDPALRAAWRHVLDYVAALHEGDPAAGAACFSEDVVLFDHRPVGWGEQRGRAAVTERFRLAVEMTTDLRISVRILDATPTALLAHIHGEGRWASGAEASIDWGHVVALRDGLGLRLEQFDPDDHATMRSRFELLSDGVVRSPPGPPVAARPVMATAFQRFLAEYVDAANRRDWPAFAAMLDPAVRAVDHRSIATFGELHGSDRFVTYVRELAGLSEDAVLSIVALAGDEWRALTRTTWTGHLDAGDGAFVYEAIVAVRLDGRRVERMDYLDGDDERAGIERLLLLEPDEHVRAVWRSQLEAQSAFNERDWEALGACFCADVVLDDRREAIPVPRQGRATATALLRSLLDPVSDGRAAVQFLDAAPGRAASRLYVYGEASTTEIGLVMLLRGGTIAQLELHEPDEVALRARFDALTREQRCEAGDEDRRRAGMDAAGVTTGAASVYERIAAFIDARDFAGVKRGFADDYLFVDARLVSPFGPETAADAHVERIESIVALSDDVRFVQRYTAVIGDVWIGWAGWVGHQNEGGGEFEIAFRCLLTVRGQDAVRIAAFDAADEARALRVAMRGVKDGPTAVCGTALDAADHPGPATRMLCSLSDALTERDWDAARSCFTPDVDIVDHRSVTSLGFDMPGGEGFLERTRALIDVAADAVPSIDVLAEIDAIAMALIDWSGHMDEGGGEFAVRWRGVIAVREGVAVRYEIFDEDDEAGMLNAVARIREEAVSSLATETEASTTQNVIAQWYERHCEAFNTRNWPGVTAGLTEDVVLLDRRPVTGWPCLRGRSEMESMWRDALTMSPDLQSFFEFVEGDDEVAITRYGWRGHAAAAEGGGAFEDEGTNVYIARAGLGCHCEILLPDTDLAILRARGEELRPLARRRAATGLPDEPLAVERLATRFFDLLEEAGRTGEWGSLEALVAADMSIVDHRPVSTFDDVRDREALIAMQQGLAQSSYDVTRRYEVLAATETFTAGVQVAQGRLVDGDGPFELATAMVVEWRDGLAARAEFFEPEDEAGLLARFAQLSKA